MNAQTTKIIPVDLKKLTELVILASNMADILVDFGCEDALYYRQQLEEWTHQ
jgi:hypothetical protein